MFFKKKNSVIFVLILIVSVTCIIFLGKIGINIFSCLSLNSLKADNIGKLTSNYIDLRRENFKDLVIVDKELNSVLFDYSDFSRSIISRSTFCRGSFNRCKFVKTVAVNSIFCESDMTEVDMLEANFEKSNLKDVCLFKSRIVRANFRNVIFDRADLRNVIFYQSDLTEASFIESDLNGADLRGSNLEKANLSGANLNKVDLTGANITGTNFRDAYMREIVWIDGKRYKLKILN